MKKVETIEAASVGTIRCLVHINRGREPHCWQYQDVPSYAPYPDGKRLAKSRRSLSLPLGKAAELLELETAELSGLEHGSRILSGDRKMDDVIAMLSGYEQDGIRDPYAPCELFLYGSPGGMSSCCCGDGHYLCQRCWNFEEGPVRI